MNITCTVCPKGCIIKVNAKNDKIISIEGNACVRGERYAKDEYLHPVRTITTTVRTEGGQLLPVKSDRPLPKQHWKKYMESINQARVMTPISIGDVVIENIHGTGVSIIATKNVKE